MKSITTLLLSFAIALSLFSQTNYALYSIENTYPVCLANDSNSFFGVHWNDKTAQINTYSFATGKVIQEYKTVLPEEPIKLIIQHPEKEILYLITEKKVDDTGARYIDAVYGFNIKRNKLKLLRKVYYNYKVPNKIGIVNNNLVLTTLNEPTWLFNLKTNDFKKLNPNTDYQLLSIAPEQKGYLMLNVREFKNDKVPVYFMNSKNEFSNLIGYVNPQVTIHSDKRHIQIPTITLEDSTYGWILKAIRYNCFPIYNFQIVMRPYWLKQVLSLGEVFSLSGILLVNKTYMITQSSNSILVYNYSEPFSSVPDNFTDEDISNLKEFLKKTDTYYKELINSDVLKQVFNALFFQVYSNNKLSHIAVQYYGNFTELKDYTQLTPFVKAGFNLSDKSDADTFQKALNALYPPDVFNRKYIKNYKLDNNWVFVRGEAFGNKYGAVVEFNDVNEIIKIEYKSSLQE